MKSTNFNQLIASLKKYLSPHPFYFEHQQVTDVTERFLASEFVREEIFLRLRQEIPYSVAVIVEQFEEDSKCIKIACVICVERNSQKGIIIGHKGTALKRVGVEARKDLERFFGKQVHLELYVKVNKNWRSNDRQLKRFGYNQ